VTGWIKLHRSLLDWEWFDDHNTFRLFTYILLKANFEPKKWHGISIARGQLLTSLPTLASETGLSLQTIRTSLTKLKSTGELTDKPTSKNRVLTVVNYNDFQLMEVALTGKSTDNLTDKQQTTNRQLTSTKEVKNIKKERKKELSRPKVSLEELSVNHIADWLAKKRTQGKYLNHNEHDILETFKNYVESKQKVGKPLYENFIAAYRNSFEWDRSQPKAGTLNPDKHQRTLEAATRGHIRAKNLDF